MKHADKNRDPERAKKRAKADLRCALRKLGVMEAFEAYQAAEAAHDPDRKGSAGHVNHLAYGFAAAVLDALEA